MPINDKLNPVLNSFLNYDRQNAIRLYATTRSYEVSEQEQRQAQLMIWRGTNKFSRKAWLIMIALVVLSLVTAGLIKYYSTYSTMICWVVIIGVVLFYLIRKFGLEWYVKRKMNEFPVQEIKDSFGVQPSRDCDAPKNWASGRYGHHWLERYL